MLAVHIITVFTVHFLIYFMCKNLNVEILNV